MIQDMICLEFNGSHLAFFVNVINLNVTLQKYKQVILESFECKGPHDVREIVVYWLHVGPFALEMHGIDVTQKFNGDISNSFTTLYDLKPKLEWSEITMNPGIYFEYNYTK